MQNFRNLEVWSCAHRVTCLLYARTKSFPREETYGLTSQIRRSAGSIGANIAEGCGRGSDQDFARFLQMAMGSASELEYHLLLAKDLHFLNSDEHHNFATDIQEVKRMLSGFLVKLRADS